VGYLGWSYDAVTGNYADVNSLLSSVLEDGAASKLVADPPLSDSGLNFLTIAGKTFDEYSQGLASNVSLEGTYGGFSGSLSASFGMTHGGSVTTAFCTTWGRTVVQRSDLKLDSTGLQEFLNKGFMDDLREVEKRRCIHSPSSGSGGRTTSTESLWAAAM